MVLVVSRRRVLKACVIVVAATLVYTAAWLGVVAFLPEATSLFAGSGPAGASQGGVERFQASDMIEVLVLKFGVLPMYWSRLGGDLSVCHLIFGFVTAFLVYRYSLEERRKIEEETA